jgi:hypothetical protein
MVRSQSILYANFDRKFKHPIIFKHCNLQNLNDTFYNLLFMQPIEHIPKTTIENLGFWYKENYMVFVKIFLCVVRFSYRINPCE